ncbi:hypothetical protein [Paraburkholderia tagetis]|uniref:Uncharacterized protein n=1 Tax=Paraburkholderia tagetis TaxID=2913261 RepID=A0A9X1UD49_9BURK|nr:hypothetical protein [Paraburkholderia tagetis]MCG5072249.1 hypothetical protein [Paraburkholderia tagetis]
MNHPGTPQQAIEVLFTIHRQLAELLVWTIFAALHLVVAVVLLWAIWYWRLQPADVASFLRTTARTAPFRLLAFVGVSFGAMLLLYLKGYRKIATWAIQRFLFAPLYARYGK